MKLEQAARAFTAEIHSNTNTVDIVCNGVTTIVVTDVFNVTAGQVGFAQAFVRGVKGGVAGDVNAIMHKNFGTAVIRFGDVGWTQFQSLMPNIPAGATYDYVYGAFFIVDTPGTLQFGAQAQSIGSSYTVPTGEGKISAWLLG